MYVLSLLFNVCLITHLLYLIIKPIVKTSLFTYIESVQCMHTPCSYEGNCVVQNKYATYFFAYYLKPCAYDLAFSSKL